MNMGMFDVRRSAKGITQTSVETHPLKVRI